jgi:hypothetical protein
MPLNGKRVTKTDEKIVFKIMVIIFFNLLGINTPVCTRNPSFNYLNLNFLFPFMYWKNESKSKLF